MRVVTEKMPHVRSVSVGIWIGTGSREESREHTGISHFIEHMVFKGTKNRSAEQIARSVDSIGGGLDAFTSKELVSYNVKVLDEHLPEAFDVVADLVRILFHEDDIEKEKGVILEELKMEVDNPEYLIHEIFSSNFWKGHPLGRPILGTKQTIRSFRPRQSRAILQAILFAIEYSNHRGRKPAHGVWSSWPNDICGFEAPADGANRRESAAARSLVFANKSSLEQVHVYLGVPSMPMPHESRFACYILNAILGGGMSSRLFQNIREKQGSGLHRVFGIDHVSGCGLHAGLRGNVAAIGRQSSGFDRARNA